MSMTLARYLKDFSAPEPPALVLDDLAFAPSGLDDDMPMLGLPEPDPVDIEQERRQAYEEGYGAARQELIEAHARESEAMETAHREAMAALEERYNQMLSQAIQAGLTKIASALAASVGEQAVAALAPVVSDLLTEKAVVDLAALIRSAILEGEAGHVTVRGPRRLFDILQGLLPEQQALLRHIETEDLDLSVDIEETALVTRISAWTASLKKVLE